MTRGHWEHKWGQHRWGPPWAWRQGRPPWWPEGEPFPPTSPQSWHRVRGRFFRRLAVGFGVLIIFTIVLSALLIWVVGNLLNLLGIAPGRSFVLQAGLTIILALMLGWLIVATRFFGHVARPVGALLEAAARVSEGDYAVRVPELGPREVRTVAQAFNAMTERLQQHEEQRRSLLADISHELRTPLTVVEGNLEGLLDGVYPRDDEHLAFVLEETRVISRLVEDLRTFALAQEAGLKLSKTQTDIAELTGEVVGSFTAQAEARGIKLVLDNSPDLPQSYVDPERIRQVLGNLLSNALRYTPEDGAVRVSLSRNGAEGITVAVEDTGAGIRGEDLPHIFDRFYKSKDSRGTGLGLAIAKSLVVAHGGEISASSAPGRGTTILFTLPVNAATES